MILSENIKQLTNATERRDAIGGALMSLADQGKLLLTHVLMLEEPFRTQCLEAMDGVELDGGKPIPGIRPTITLPPVRLVAVKKSEDGQSYSYDPNGNIRVKRMTRVPILGTLRTRDESKWINLGKDVTVDAREARTILSRWGHPMVEETFRGNVAGTCVEYGWIKSEAAKPGCPDYIRTLAAEIDAAAAPAAPVTHKKGNAQASL